MSEYTETWETYLTYIEENKVGSILVDVGIGAVAPIAANPHLIKVILDVKSPDEHGFPGGDEYQRLNQIDDCCSEIMQAKFDAIYSGRLKYDGRQGTYYYSATAVESERLKAELQKCAPDYDITVTTAHDPEWQAYFQILFPSGQEYQMIQNQKVIQHLEELGDNLEIEREVDHFIHFASENDREQFLAAIAGNNFEVKAKGIDEEYELPFSLNISRTDRVDPNSVNDYVLFLWETAKEHNGNYDGWGSSVVG